MLATPESGRTHTVQAHHVAQAHMAVFIVIGSPSVVHLGELRTWVICGRIRTRRSTFPLPPPPAVPTRQAKRRDDPNTVCLGARHVGAGVTGALAKGAPARRARPPHPGRAAARRPYLRPRQAGGSRGCFVPHSGSSRTAGRPRLARRRSSCTRRRTSAGDPPSPCPRRSAAASCSP